VKLFLLTLCLTVLAACGETRSPIESESSIGEESIHIIPMLGTNVGVIEGDEALIIIDPGFEADQFSAFKAALFEISDKPVRFVFNTHSHSDHTSGNELLASAGATIIAHENIRYSSAYVETTFADVFKLEEDGLVVEAYYVPSHSYDDILIWFPDANVLFLGDTFTNSAQPTYYSGGISGQRRALKRALSIADPETLIVPGHGKATNKIDLIAYKEKTEAIHQHVLELHSKGLNVSEIQEDEGYQDLMLQFSSDRAPAFLSQTSVSRFVPRIIASDFVPAIELDSKQSTRLIGRYVSEDETVYEISLKNDRLFFHSDGSFMAELLPVTETQFRIRAAFRDNVTFEIIDDEAISFIISAGDRTITANRTPP